jgi:hypothetical protein
MSDVVIVVGKGEILGSSAAFENDALTESGARDRGNQDACNHCCGKAHRFHPLNQTASNYFPYMPDCAVIKQSGHAVKSPAQLILIL